MTKVKYLTRQTLVRLTGAPPYIISYLKDTGRLPVYKESAGIGYPTKYDPKAIDIIKKHLGKQLENDNNIQSFGASGQD